MKAIVQHTYGSPEVLTLAEVERPRPGDHEVLVEVLASMVSQGDRRLRSGDFPGITWLPGRLMMGLTGPRHAIRGTNFAGRIVEVGSAVTRFSVGDDVFGSTDSAAWAEYLVVAEDSAIASLPAGFDHAEAAALPYGGVTALVFLRDLGKLQPGEHLAILGASGGVGRLAIQVAKHLGAEVTAVSSAPTHDLVRSLGADHVVDYRTADFRDAGRYDVVLDTIGASRFDRVRRALTPTGRYLTLIMSVRTLLQMLTTSLVGKQRAITGVALGGRDELETLRELAEQGALRPVIDTVFPLEQIAEAHALVESGGAHGSVGVRVQAASDGERLRLATAG